MVLIRCTEALRRKLKRDAIAPTPGAASTTALGDWYGHVIRPGRRSLLLFISEHSRLPVLLPLDALRGSKLETALPAAVRAVLVALGIDRARIDREVAEMTPFAVAKTASRSLVGTLNEFAWLLQVVGSDDAEEDNLARALRLADTPIMAAGGEDPAALLKVARYKIDAVEKGPVHGYQLETAVRYFRLLGLEIWIARWAHANRDLSRRQGLGR